MISWKTLSSLLLTLSLSLPLWASDYWITLETTHLARLSEKMDIEVQRHALSQGKPTISLIRIEKENLDNLVEIMSQRGNYSHFMGHESYEEAIQYIYYYQLKDMPNIYDYGIDQEEKVLPAMSEVKESNIFEMIKTLSAYKNRYYTADSGKEAALAIKAKWTALTAGRSDISISLFTHNWKQPSVILTIKGQKTPENIVFMGAHEDSTAGYFGGASSTAPGADDNASGVAVLTEMIRTLVQTNYAPANTIQIAAYAGEEAGLLGSKAIASQYKQQYKKVIGVLNLDMTNYKGSENGIYLISDNTDSVLNNFMGQLIDTYIKVPWGFTACGYGCSDHASWKANGFPATYAFESTSEEYNPNIHTSKDLLDPSIGVAHSMPFARLAVAYAIEMGK